MIDKWTDLQKVIAFCNRCKCLWVYFGGRPVPVNWHVTTLSPTCHTLDGLWSIAGPVAAGLEVCVAEDECFEGLIDKLLLHYYRPCICPVRPLKLADYSLAEIPMGRRHEYNDKVSREIRRDRGPMMF